MINVLISAGLSILIVFSSLIGAFYYLPLSIIETNPDRNIGTSITTILGIDTLSSSRTTINNNFTALNAGKIENSTTTLPHLTTLLNLTSVGTIGTGVWQGTPIGATWGGTGSSTLALNQLLLGNGTGILKTVSGFGTTGQFLTSNGASSAPTWQTGAIDQSGTYNWKGTHNFYGTSNMTTLTVTSTAVFTGNTTMATTTFTGPIYSCTGGMGYQPQNTTGNQVINHSLGTTPTYFSIRAWAAKGPESVSSFGQATTTTAGGINQHSTWNYIDVTPGLNPAHGQSTTTIIRFTSPYLYADKVVASVTAYTATNFTLNWSTNGTDWNANFYEWQVCR